LKILGINCMNHDAAMAVVDYSSGIGEILWAAHAERYSKVKNDHYLNQRIVDEAYTFGPFDKVVYYEKPLLKKTRQFYAGQYGLAMSYTEMPQWHLDHFGIKIDEYVKHHDSHAAAGYFTSPFKDEGATILTVDAIGEWDTVSISTADKVWIHRKETIKYPHSIGILYSAFTHRCGLKPAEEEYILMGMAAYGRPKYKQDIYNDFVNQSPFSLKKNLHRGLSDWHPEADVMDIAASIQAVTEECLADLWTRASRYGSRNLVYAGGVALNCAANRVLANMGLFDNIWIIPNPGDAGSSLGCIAAHQKSHLNWEHPFLGHNIEGEYPVDALIKELKENKMVGVASGRAEFGPRALGNRSLLADPRGEDIKDLVNSIKKRQQFRPFAPAILEEDVNDYFELPKAVKNTPYMQFTAACTHGKEFPAIIHYDHTSRVQTVRKTDNPGFHALLTEWKRQTGCPILLNTSLNIKGQPIVNDRQDGQAFTKKYGVKVLG
jgi:carbamoyltransferase